MRITPSSHFRSIPWMALGCGVFLALLIPGLVWGQTQKEKPSESEEEEFLQEEEFPDLVGRDEKDEIMDEFALLEDADIVESAARHRQEIGWSPSAITVITREDIETSGADSIPDLLRMVPGMNVVRLTPAWISTVTRLFWNTNSYWFLVLVDGREANLDVMGGPMWALEPISLEDIEKIEVIRGPASSLYGAKAFTGVISISTRLVPETSTGWLKVQAGENGAYTIQGRGATRIEDLGISLSTGYERSGMFSDPRMDGLEIWKVRSLVDYRLSNSRRLFLDSSFSQGVGRISTSVGDTTGHMSFSTIRLAFESEQLRAHVYWKYMTLGGDLHAPLWYGGIRLAKFSPLDIDSHNFNGQVQWTLPNFWEPLLVIVGGEGRALWLFSDSMLDAQGFLDPQSPGYHQLGAEFLDWRGGAFAHAELAPNSWLTLTGGIRIDYNNYTDWFLSPRVTAVFQPSEGHFLRLGVARAFRQPIFVESGIHPSVEFPDDSPIQGPDQEKFLEFMARNLGNDRLTSEKIVSVEAGYQGRFLGGKVALSWDLYFNRLEDFIDLGGEIVVREGLPDLDKSTFQFFNNQKSFAVLGSELSIQVRLSREAALMAAWSYQEPFTVQGDEIYSWGNNGMPKHLLTLGGRFRTDWGLLGSLYLFSRSDFLDSGVPSPGGILEPFLVQQMDIALLVIGRLGWDLWFFEGLNLEAGIKWFVPLSPFSGDAWGYYEKGGGVSPSGDTFGSERLSRRVMAYVQSSF